MEHNALGGVYKTMRLSGYAIRSYEEENMTNCRSARKGKRERVFKEKEHDCTSVKKRKRLSNPGDASAKATQETNKDAMPWGVGKGGYCTRGGAGYHFGKEWLCTGIVSSRKGRRGSGR